MGFRSNREVSIEKWLCALGIEVQHSFRTYGLEWDLYLPKLRVAFEFNGIHYHYHSANRRLRGCSPKPVDYHYKKTLQAKLNGVNLYHFWDFESDASVRQQITTILQGGTLSTTDVDKNPNLVGMKSLKLTPRYICADRYALYAANKPYDTKPMGFSSAPVLIYEYYNAGIV